MAELIIYRGLPASGKTRSAREFIAKLGSDKTLRVNRDDIRKMLHGDAKWSGGREKVTVSVRNTLIRQGLLANKTVISDDTNLSPKVVAELRAIAEECKAKVTISDYTNVPPWKCIENDLGPFRQAVGADVIWKMYRQYLKPKPIVQNWNLPRAIIVDMDGTLALLGDRSPYEDDKAYSDPPNLPVIRMVKGFLSSNPDVSLLVMSGRDDGRSRTCTSMWLERYGLNTKSLFMRTAGDMRADSIIKRELFDANVRDTFFVEFVVDDRDSVVQLWRDEIGLPTFQVGWGDF